MKPDGWKDLRLTDIARVVGGIGFPREYQGNRFGPLPFFKVSDMNAPGNERELRAAANTIDAQALKGLKGTAQPAGTVVFPKVGAALLTNKRRLLAVSSIFDNNVMGLVPTACNPDYLYYIMQTVDFSNYVQPGAVPSVNGSTVGSIRVLVPTLGEQYKIAAVLSSVDDAIEKTQAVMDQVQVVKRGLTQELLTRGLPGRHTQFKRLPNWRLGRVTGNLTKIPASWDLVPIVSVARLESGHTPSRRNPEYWHGDVPWISLHDTAALDQPEIYETEQYISELGLRNSSARLLPRGTVVLSRTATIGKSTIMARDMSTTQDFANYVCGPRLHNRYLMHVFRHMQPEWQRLMAGSTHKTVYMPIFEQLEILLPPAEEQQAIADVVECFDARIQAEREANGQFGKLKSALMSVLLTGELRVASDFDPA